jgi:serine/threonine protein kinase
MQASTPFIFSEETKYSSFQVAASKTKIYMVLEFVDGGELFDRIVSPPKFNINDTLFLHSSSSLWNELPFRRFSFNAPRSFSCRNHSKG